MNFSFTTFWKMMAVAVVIIIFNDKAFSQAECDCPYPIIFVHGWAGSEESWADFIDEVKPFWKGQPDVFYAVLNANRQELNIPGILSPRAISGVDGILGNQDDDVLFSFINEDNILLNSCLYSVNFDNFWNEDSNAPLIIKNSQASPPPYSSDSNESAAFKQGYALGKAIERVLLATSKEKVILVGHSMGGLAIREYLQRRTGNSPTWWVNQNVSNGHQVAKVFTVGTPHLGSNTGDEAPDFAGPLASALLGFDLQSEAVRDLRYSYNNDQHPGVYLFGGSEGTIPITQGTNEYYYNLDVNCNGTDQESVEGINEAGTSLPWNGTTFNPQLPLPSDIKYSYYVSDVAFLPAILPANSDGIVLANRQWLYQGGSGSSTDFLNGSSIPTPFFNQSHFLSDRITVRNSSHVSALEQYLNGLGSFETYETGDFHNVVRGLDEADYPYFAYKIDFDKQYAGLAQKRADKVPTNSAAWGNGDNMVDSDWYLVDLNQSGLSSNQSIKIDFSPVSSYVSEYKLEIFNGNINEYSNDISSPYFISGNTNTSLQTKTVPISFFNSSQFYIRITNQLTNEQAWRYPYKINVTVEEVCQLTKIDATGNYTCNEIEVTIDGDPNIIYQVGETDNTGGTTANAQPIFLEGGTTAMVPFNNDNSGWVTIYATDIDNPDCPVITKQINIPECINVSISTADFPEKIHSPVYGDLTIDKNYYGGSNISSTHWLFWQWGAETGDCLVPFTHCAGKGIVGGNGVRADDTYAWDCNLAGDADVGKPVYAIANGERVSEGGWGGSACNQLLIRHTLPNGRVWYSSYLHLNTRIIQDCYKMGEQIGTVGDECAANNHLHFAIYTKDEVGTFISHDAEIIPNSVEVNFGQVLIGGRAEDPTDIVVHFEVPMHLSDNGIAGVSNVTIGGVSLPVGSFLVTSLGNKLFKFIITDIPANLFENQNYYDLQFNIVGSSDNITGYGSNMVYFLGSAATAFNDYDGNHGIKQGPAEKYINTATYYGLFKGYANGRFGPNDQLTRGQAAKVICDIAIKANKLNLNVSNEPFIDVPQCHEFFPYIQTLKNEDIVVGIGNDSFGVNGYFSYEAMAKILVKALRIDLEFDKYCIIDDLKSHTGIYRQPISIDDFAPGTDASLIDFMIFLDRIVAWTDHSLDSDKPAGQNSKCRDWERLIEKSAFDVSTSGGLVDGKSPLKRGDFAIVASKAYELVTGLNQPSECGGTTPSPMIRPSIMTRSNAKECSGDPIPFASNIGTHTIIGSKLTLPAITTSDAPSAVNTEIVMYNGDVKEWDGPEFDANGNKLAYFWESNGGDLEIVIPGDFSRVTFTPPFVSSPTSFNLYLWLGNDKGKISQANINIIVLPEGCCPLSSNLKVNSVSETTANISWSNIGNGDEVGNYTIELSTDNVNWSIYASNYSSTSINLTGLITGQTYYARVISNCTNGTISANSTEVSFTTQGLIIGGGVGECLEGESDTENPIFLNCPSNTITFGNDPDECGAYANWAIPIADDNCLLESVTQTSGPASGSFLSPGVYNIIYTAIDTAGNSSNCEFQVKVIDTQLPEINCPQDVTVSTDIGVCEASVNNIAPEFAFDNCNYSVTWIAIGTTPNNGVDDASGTIFPIGTTTLTYFISELSNPDGNRTATCDIIVTVIDDETPMITCPANVTIGTSMGGIDDCEGEYTWTHPTPTDNCGVTLYTITYNNPDGTTEGPINLVGLGGTSVTRDFYKGLTTMLYRVEDAAGNFIECTFTVLVLDDENPMIFCEEVVATNQFTFETPIDIRPNDVTQAIIHVAPSMTITDFNILALAGTHPDMGDLTVTLTSPAGTTVTLFDGLCISSADFDMALDDAATASVTTAACGPLGGGSTLIPQELLAAFNGENSAGDWVLTFTNNHIGKCGVLTDYRIQIIGNDVTAAGNRLQVQADPHTCTYTMLGTDFDPRFTDNCPDPYIRHNYIFGPFDSTLQGSEFSLGEHTVTWTVYDQSGNTASCNLIVEVLDTQKPHFTNCPRLDIIQNVETERCGAYVTFSEPLATDNCWSATVTKTDQTGLNSGSIFPSGTTILEYLATDPSGNTAVCSLRVIVNDHIPPTMECPPSVTESTDPWKCSAIVYTIAPQNVNDNCRDNLSIQYQIEYPLGSGIIVDGGMADASGTEFLDGVSQVTYKLSDQPHLLITEVTHDIGITNGGMDPVPYTVLTTNDYVEITNLGAASINASGLQVERLGNMMAEVFTIPDNTIIGVGQTLVIHFGNGTDDPANLFFNVPCAVDMHTSQGAAYVMSFKGRVLDVVAVNGFAPIGLGSVAVVGSTDWSGSIPTMRSKGGVIRKFSYDNHIAGDWIVADVCHMITIGQVNPTIDISPDNGTLVGFQSIMPNMVTCQFKVTILDQELPYCGEFLENIYNNATNLNVPNSIVGGKVFKSVVNVPEGFLVGNVDLLDIVGQHPEMSDLIFKLTSPEGTQVVLFEGLCQGSADFDFSLNSDSLTSILDAPCGPLGGGGTFAPINSLCKVNDAFYGENAQGNWTLEIADTTAANNGLLSNWTLRLWEINNYSQGDTTYNNEPGLCGADFTWVHPRIIDNCKVGTVELKYLSDMDIPLPTSPGIIVQADTLTEFFAVGTTIVRYILTDGSGNIDSCEFNVTIRDVDKPRVSCPGDKYVFLDGGECRAQVCYWPVLATDNCAVTDTTYSIEPCTFFEIGTTPVTIYISDDAGNVDSCTFKIFIVEHEPKSNTLTCNDHINISLDQDCKAEIVPDMLFEGDDYRCYEDYIVTLKDPSDNVLATSPFVYIEYEGKTLTFSVYDPVSGNSCWGTILIEAKAIPLIECPPDTMIYCSTNKDLKDEFGDLLLGEVLLKSCKPDVQITREDLIVKNAQCSDPIAIIYRTFLVSDKVGNETSCTQNITVKAFDFDQIIWPKDAVLSCEQVSEFPLDVHPDSLGYPMIDGVIVDKVNSICNLSHTYEDQYLWICGGSYEIIRKWVVRNRCEGLSATNPIIYYQLIEVLDKKNPTLAPCPDNIVLNVDPWTCSGSGFLPVPENMGDKCSPINFEAYIFGGGFMNMTGSILNNDLKIFVSNIKKGSNTKVKYVLTDECGNESICLFPIHVIDQTPPVTIAKQNVVLSLSGDGNGGGYAKLYGYQIDNGSYDPCSDIRFEVRRVDGGSCGNEGVNGWNNNSTFNGNNFPNEVPGSIWFHPMDSKFTPADGNYDTDVGEFVKFCCEDIPAGEEYGLHDVELRVWDDGNMNGIYGDNFIIDGMKDNYNTTWVTVRVENKLPPHLVCPPDVEVSCDMELNLSVGEDTNVNDVDLTMTGYPHATDLCNGLDVTYRDAWVGAYDDICKSGTIRRTFTAKKGSVSVTCVQYITVITNTFPFTVTFPQDGQTTAWDRCGFSIDDINDQNNFLIKRPVVNNGPCDIVLENVKIDTFLNENGACKKWKVTYNYLNWCTKEERGPFVHYYTFKDVEAPILTCNNQMFAANPLASNPNGACYGSVVLEASATDPLICAEESWVKWQVFADLWANGTVDRLGSTFVNKAYNGIWVYVPKYTATGALNPAWTNLQTLHPNVVLADDLYVTYIKPSAASGGTVKLPAFDLLGENINHKVLWKVTDGCGNVDQCESTIMSVDKKAPTPYCVSVHTAIMQTTPKMVELWAVDFNKGSFDNCTPQSKLFYTFDGTQPILSRINEVHYFKGVGQNATLAEYNQGKAYKWLPTSRSAGHIWLAAGDYAVNVSVWDEAWNTDFCTVSLQILDDSNSSRVSGNVLSMMQIPMENVLVNYQDNTGNDKSAQTNSNGKFEIIVGNGSFVNVALDKNIEFMDGVSTLDLVMIQRHILGIENFASPYKVIAADADNNGKISVNDLSEIRKLILGINTEYPHNKSWRFTSDNQKMDQDNPFPFIEKLDVPNLTSDIDEQNFTGIKIGDVNGSAVVNPFGNLVETRTQKGIKFSVADVIIQPGETVRIPVTASNYNDIFGYQFTMGMRGTLFVEVESGALAMTNANVGVHTGKLTMSYSSDEAVSVTEGEVLFTLVLKATEATTVSEVLSMGSDITPAESYIGKDMEVGKVSLEVRNAETAEFALYQNEPNPFRTETVIRYNMPEAGSATITVYDVAGKVAAQRVVNAVKGMNTEKFTRADINASGVLMYKVESGDHVGTKKMIIID
ncbi:MAG: HYR domain-containing protein [Lewinellaceae bacterium]|nr:HYR domain-containing protein [Lewinellaceae bacterium]